jgi:hypothetical protein
MPEYSGGGTFSTIAVASDVLLIPLLLLAA